MKRYETCVKCGRSWNVSVYAKVHRSGYICPHCRRKITKTIAKAMFYVGMFLLGTILCKIEADKALIERGHFAIGGEWLLPLLPLECYMLSDMIKDTVTTFKELWLQEEKQ